MPIGADGVTRRFIEVVSMVLVFLEHQVPVPITQAVDWILQAGNSTWRPCGRTLVLCMERCCHLYVVDYHLHLRTSSIGEG